MGGVDCETWPSAGQGTAAGISFTSLMKKLNFEK
jgi:hypothetical protein